MDRTDRPDCSDIDEPRVTIEMGGSNIVIRSTTAIDHAYTDALAHAVNAATDTLTAVVIDPEPIRCDDSFASYSLGASAADCVEHHECRAVAVEVIGVGMIRIAAERTVWTVDVGAGRFCRSDAAIDAAFIPSGSWTPVVAICVTPRRLIALTLDDTLISSNRAHAPKVRELAAAG